MFAHDRPSDGGKRPLRGIVARLELRRQNTATRIADDDDFVHLAHRRRESVGADLDPPGPGRDGAVAHRVAESVLRYGASPHPNRTSVERRDGARPGHHGPRMRQTIGGILEPSEENRRDHVRVTLRLVLKPILPGERIIEGRVDSEDAQQSRDAQKPQDLPFGDGEPNLPASLFGPALGADQGAESGRIEELDTIEIDDEPMISAIRSFEQGGTYRGRRRHIQASRKLEDLQFVDLANVDR